MTKQYFRSIMTFIAAELLTVTLSGCQTSSGSSVRTYDYDDSGAGRARHEPVETEREVESGEWEMVAPGQPVVDPKR